MGLLVINSCCNRAMHGLVGRNSFRRSSRIVTVHEEELPILEGPRSEWSHRVASGIHYTSNSHRSGTQNRVRNPGRMQGDTRFVTVAIWHSFPSSKLNKKLKTKQKTTTNEQKEVPTIPAERLDDFLLSVYIRLFVIER